MSGGNEQPRPWRRAAAWLAFLAPLFYLTYGAANAVAARRTGVPALVFGWEHFIPFVDWTILPYWSINAFYAASLFVCRNRGELDVHARRLLAAQIIAVSFFMLTPLAYTFTRPATDGLPGFMFAALTSFDKPFNQAPSLHIALMIILWSLYTRLLRGPARWLFHGWFFLIGVSVLTTYQHHFIDIPTGLWLGWFCVALFPLDERHRPGGWWPQRLGAARGTTDARLRQLATRYVAAGLLLALPGAMLIAAADVDAAPSSALAIAAGAASALAGIVLCWSALSLLCVAGIYLSGNPRKFQKNSDGSMSMAVRWLLGPYLLGAWFNSRWWTRHSAAHAEVAPGVWLSRVPHTAHLRQRGVRGVVDLIAELPLRTHGIASVRLPVLDLTVPPVATLREAAQAIERLRAAGPVWVCCALGYSRSASAVAAWLLHCGRARDRDEAERVLRAARPQVVLSDAHWAAIEQASQR